MQRGSVCRRWEKNRPITLALMEWTVLERHGGEDCGRIDQIRFNTSTRTPTESPSPSVGQPPAIGAINDPTTPHEDLHPALSLCVGLPAKTTTQPTRTKNRHDYLVHRRATVRRTYYDHRPWPYLVHRAAVGHDHRPYLIHRAAVGPAHGPHRVQRYGREHAHPPVLPADISCGLHGMKRAGAGREAVQIRELVERVQRVDGQEHGPRDEMRK